MSLVLVAGLPGAGKTTLCHQLKQSFETALECVLVCSFDDFITECGALTKDNEFTSKASVLRKAWQVKVEEIVDDLTAAEKKRFVLLVDDIFYFTSMRRTFERMARAFGLAYITILVECSVEDAKTRNRERPLRKFHVSDDVIQTVSDRFELPYALKNVIRYRNPGDLDEIARVVINTESRPHRRLVEMEPVQDHSVWKQLDHDLRKAVGMFLRGRCDISGEVVSANKKKIFEKMKSGGITEWDLEGLWSKKEDESVVGVAWNRVWQLKRLDDEHIEYDVVGRFSRGAFGRDEDVLRDYFQLDVDLAKLYREWAEKDKNFAGLVEGNVDKLEGIRILRQRLDETLFAFILSANNNIQRISKLVNTLCALYGEKLELPNGDIFFDFPNLENLEAVKCEEMESALRKNAFGYRAGYIAKSVAYILENGREQWLNDLAKMPTDEAREALMMLPGIGRKVADCICLMALRKHEIVPVDTHVLQITTSMYLPKLAPKNGKKATLNEKVHKEIGDFYLQLFGSHAGWAHSVLFSSRLKHITSSKVTKKSR